MREVLFMVGVAGIPLVVWGAYDYTATESEAKMAWETMVALKVGLGSLILIAGAGFAAAIEAVKPTFWTASGGKPAAPE